MAPLGKDQFSAALAVPSKAPLKWRQSTPLNTAVMFVPQVKVIMLAMTMLFGRERHGWSREWASTTALLSRA